MPSIRYAPDFQDFSKSLAPARLRIEPYMKDPPIIIPFAAVDGNGYVSRMEKLIQQVNAGAANTPLEIIQTHARVKLPD